jgi:hypothetical protein
MANLRKLLLALTVVLVATITASAQTVPPFQCTASAAVPPFLRAEGLTELIGDIVLTCSGGTPTALGRPVPRVNVEVFVNAPVNITSRLVSGSFSEALLLIDDPDPDDPLNPNPQVPCTTPAVGCTQTGVYTAPPPAPGGTGIPYKSAGLDGAGVQVKNVYQAVKAAENRLVWFGVPVDPPGTTLSRVLRIKNVRIDASALAGGLIPTPVVAFVSISGESTVPVYSPQQIVGYVQSGLSVAYRTAADAGLPSAGASFLQCTSVNSDLAASPTASFTVTAARIRFTENFGTAFKKRNRATSLATPTAELPQRSPALSLYTTETGFYNPLLGSTNNLENAGRANSGTRLRVVFTDVPAGVSLFVSTRQWGAPAGTTQLVLVNVAPDGSGDFAPVNATTTSAYAIAPVPVSGGVGVAVWEVVDTDPNQVESVDVGVVIAYRANPPAGLPALGTMKASASFAPISTLNTQQGMAVPIPRFRDTGTARNLVVINPCQTNLLFPFVTNQAGFDTGIAIANTSRDPFGTVTQSGACTLNYYGAGPGGAAAPSPQTSSVIAAGDVAVFTLSAGGTHGITATPGFQGYIIAQCRFQYAHGFAFISDLGAAKLSHGYLALVMDAPLSSRTGFASETLGQ